MSEPIGFVTLNFSEVLTEPSTTLDFGGGVEPPPDPPAPVIKHLSLNAVVERLIINAQAGHQASQDAIKKIVIDKFKANKLVANLDAAAVAY